MSRFEQSNLSPETKENKWNASSDSKSNCYHIKVTIDWITFFFNEPVSQILKLERVQLYDVQVKLFFDLIFCLFFVVELIC